MPHQRTTIRNAFVALLGPLGFPVHVGPVTPEQLAALPSLAVTTPTDATDEEAGTFRREDGTVAQARLLVVNVEIRAATSAGDLLDVLDALALSVETALGADPEMGGASDWVELESTETELAGDLEQPAGVQTLRYVARYRVTTADPSTPI